MNEESQIKALFDEFLAAIAGKDADKLRGMADESLAVRHVMTGNVQSGADFISDAAAEEFTFFSVGGESTDLRIIGNTAFVIGRFTADCAIYGMERSERSLCMKLTLRSGADGWKFTEIRISASSEL